MEINRHVLELDNRPSIFIKRAFSSNRVPTLVQERTLIAVGHIGATIGSQSRFGRKNVSTVYMDIGKRRFLAGFLLSRAIFFPPSNSRDHPQATPRAFPLKDSPCSSASW